MELTRCNEINPNYVMKNATYSDLFNLIVTNSGQIALALLVMNDILCNV